MICDSNSFSVRKAEAGVVICSCAGLSIQEIFAMAGMHRGKRGELIDSLNKKDGAGHSLIIIRIRIRIRTNRRHGGVVARAVAWDK